MIGLGTLIDVTLILLGGFAGLAFGRFINERIQDTLLKATAVAIIFIGISGAMSGMLTVSGGEISAGGSALVVISLALGSLIGEMLDLERQIDRFGEWLKYATGSSGDSEAAATPSSWTPSSPRRFPSRSAPCPSSAPSRTA